MEEIGEQVRHDFKPKTWNEIKTNDSWTIFRVMSEFVNGFEIMARIGPNDHGHGQQKERETYQH